MRIAVADGGDGDAGAEIEITLAAFGDQPYALASLEPQRGTRIGVIQRRGFGHGAGLPISVVNHRTPAKKTRPEKSKMPPCGGDQHYFLFALQCQQNCALSACSNLYSGIFGLQQALLQK